MIYLLFSRTQQSAESLLEGLYPITPSNGERDSSSIDSIQLIPINTMDQNTENMFPNTNTCPTLNEYVKEWKNTEEYKRYYSTKVEPILSQISSIFNVPLKYVDIETMFDCFQTHACHMKEFPEGFKLFL
eukprot:TRINITY_DN591_c0_g1_i14.p1 TRINITY_DN591_c0_g1~~TRINITY_DN591_c0_g1_i14.p1  ORF type:complete len:130 (+),score=21.93 TRINITY_DN591_c0_g1_i14:150-539(+)